MKPEDYSLIESLWDRIYKLETSLRSVEQSFQDEMKRVVKLTAYISENVKDEPEAKLGDYVIESAIALLKKYRAELNK
jgi:hypothetical protein